MYKRKNANYNGFHLGEDEKPRINKIRLFSTFEVVSLFIFLSSKLTRNLNRCLWWPPLARVYIFSRSIKSFSTPRQKGNRALTFFNRALYVLYMKRKLFVYLQTDWEGSKECGLVMGGLYYFPFHAWSLYKLSFSCMWREIFSFSKRPNGRIC